MVTPKRTSQRPRRRADRINERRAVRACQSIWCQFDPIQIRRDTTTCVQHGFAKKAALVPMNQNLRNLVQLVQ